MIEKRRNDNIKNNIFSVRLSVCLFPCLYPINVKTAEPTEPKILMAANMIPGNIQRWPLSEQQLKATTVIRNYRKRPESLVMIIIIIIKVYDNNNDYNENSNKNNIIKINDKNNK